VTDPKPLVFISHITEERNIAEALKRILQKSFLGMIEVFVSSSPDSIPAGNNWLETISNALNSCRAEIILASPISVKRPWINFEAGAGWVRGVPIVPLCHSGMTPSKLPVPLNLLQTFQAKDEDSLRKRLLPILAQVVGCEVPEIDLTELLRALSAYHSEEDEYTWVKDGLEAACQGAYVTATDHGDVDKEWFRNRTLILGWDKSKKRGPAEARFVFPLPAQHVLSNLSAWELGLTVTSERFHAGLHTRIRGTRGAIIHINGIPIDTIDLTRQMDNGSDYGFSGQVIMGPYSIENLFHNANDLHITLHVPDRVLWDIDRVIVKLSKR
jgi:hypothetical protein